MIIGAFLISIAVSIGVCAMIRSLAIATGYVDRPKERHGKLHQTPIPYGGGWAIFLSWLLVLGALWMSGAWPTNTTVSSSQLLALIISSLIIIVGGMWDDWFDSSPRTQLAVSLLAVVVLIIGGVRLSSVTIPAQGNVSLVWADTTVWGVLLQWPADVITIVWLMVMMYATKLFDGIDGLVSGLGTIGGIILCWVSLLPTLNQPQNAVLAITFAGACGGMWYWNWHPARLFLGQGGSLLVGFLLGSLSILTGTKVISTMLVVGIALFDLVWVIGRRALIERRNPFIGDQKHLHHRLLSLGFSQRQASSSVLMLSAVFGILAVVLQTQQKILALGVMAILLVSMGAVIVFRQSRMRH